MRSVGGAKLLVAAILAGVLVIAGALALRSRGGATTSVPATSTNAVVHRASLYCEFFDFMHKAVVASYDFTLDGRTPPRFLLRATVIPDGTRIVSADDQKPVWSYVIEDDTPTLVAPEGDARIVLYGLEPRAGGVMWGEAGVRSTATRNLEGRCRQAYFDEAFAGRVATSRIEKGPTP